MSEISKIDKNFTVETELNLPDVVFYLLSANYIEEVKPEKAVTKKPEPVKEETPKAEKSTKKKGSAKKKTSKKQDS